jgi:hypothetical protein
VTDTVLAGETVPVRAIKAQETSAWRYSMGYELEIETRPGVDQNACTNPPEDNFYFYKVRLVFPDGSKHLLRLRNDPDYKGDGYHRHAPDGRGSGLCQSQLATLPNPLIYYSTDGTFVRFVVYHHDSERKDFLDGSLPERGSCRRRGAAGYVCLSSAAHLRPERELHELGVCHLRFQQLLHCRQ